jgi:hypothetical protein
MEYSETLMLRMFPGEVASGTVRVRRAPVDGCGGFPK